MRQGGITLLELLISLAITSAVVVALLGFTSMHVDIVNRNSTRAQLGVDLMYLMDYFARLLPGAGGELLPVWSSLMVENDCAARTVFPDCAGSDRLTVVNVAGTVSCAVRGVAPGKLLLDNSSGTCCLAAMPLQGRHIMAVKINAVANRYVNATDAVACTVDVAPGPVAFSDTATEPYDWTGGMVFPINMQTFYLDRNLQELNRFTYTNGGTGVNQGTNSGVADRVMDFQVALGFDFDPADGVVRDTGDENDEYLYNSTAVAEVWNVGKFLNVSHTTMRMIEVGLILGFPSSTPVASGPTRVLDGPVVSQPTWILEPQATRLTIRSTRTYE